MSGVVRQSTWKGAWLLVCILTLVSAGLSGGCEEKASEGEEEGPAEPVDRGDPVGEPIKVYYDWPGDQAYRSSRYEIPKYKDGWEIPNNVVEPLIAAATTNLLPSDGMKSCRYSDAYPTFKVEIPHEGDTITLISNSRCLNWAPWNVIKDGKLHVQTTGDIGKALYPVLVELDKALWENETMPSEGRVELFGESVVPVPEGVETQESPAAGALAKLNDWPRFKERFEDAEAKDLKIYCDQKRSSTCRDLMAVATVDYKGWDIRIQLELTLDDVKEIRFPETDDELNKFLESKLFKAMEASAGDQESEIYLSYDPDSDCANLERGAETYRPDEDVAGLSCAHYLARLEYEGAETLPPQIKYFPALDAARLIGWVDKTDPEFFKRIGAPDTISDSMILDRTWVFSTLDGEVTEILK